MSKLLTELLPGDVVRMKLPGQTQWSRAVCKYQEAPRSYLVECNGCTYRRNHKDLRSTAEPEPDILTNDASEPVDSPQVLIPSPTADPAPAEVTGDTSSPSKSPVKVTSRGRIIRPPKKKVPNYI